MGTVPRESRRALIDGGAHLSLRQQCELLDLPRSGLYYKASEKTLDDIDLLNHIRDIWVRYPFYGYRRITRELQATGFQVNRKRVQRLMALGGIYALHPGPNTSKRHQAHAIHPYLLKDVKIDRPDQAWMVDITYLRMPKGFVYLTALIDVHSRYIVGWSLSTSLETSACIDALNKGLRHSTPEIINSDQGAQFTSEQWVNCLHDAGIQISMTGKGRCLDNVYIERFWRSFKQEEFYLNAYSTLSCLKQAIKDYVAFYNHKRWHQSLDYNTPASIYLNGGRDKGTIIMCTSPSEQPAPFGACDQVMDNTDVLPTT